MQQSELDFINTLRQATPYLEKHRGKTLVLYLPGSLLESETTLSTLVEDVRLLHTLGLKLVLAVGATPHIDQALSQAQIPWRSAGDIRITTNEMLPIIQQTVGMLRSRLEAAFSRSLNSAQITQPLTLLSGNWVIAKPKGVINGVDFQHTGTVRKLQHSALQSTLDAGGIALLTPLSYSLTGELFNLNTQEQALAVAQHLQADKLMIFTESKLLEGLPKQISAQSLQTQCDRFSHEQQQLLSPFADNLKVKRVHLLPMEEPDTLLYELFTLDGKGCMIFTDRYHQLRPATIEDVGGIMNLIAPLEAQGILLKRSRESLELEIEHFIVIERDQQIIGCAALYPHGKQGELACLAIDKAHQNQSLGEELLRAIEAQAKTLGIEQLFLLTTQSQHWFIEHGFQPADLSVLPEEKQSLYNYQRQSKVLIKHL
jgi:amino-acid N-acetyltransferase